MSDAELIARVLVGEDRASFGLLVQRHQSAVRQFLRHLTRGDVALADDLAQETFVTAWRTLARFHGGSTFLTWLLGIAHNHSRNAHRSIASWARSNTSLGEAHSENLTAAPGTQNADLRHDLAVALRELTAEEQLAIHLHYQLGQSHPEISALLDWPLGTVKTHIARGKEKLRQHLAAWNPQT